MRGNKFKISIITPSYNPGPVIKRAIESVLVQDYDNWEHIVVDGGSTDGTLQILKEYPHLRWISEPDSGQAEAMGKGFKMSTGDIIIYLNADDYLAPNVFTTVVREFEKGATFVVGDIYVKSPRQNANYINTPRVTLEGMLRHWEPNAFPQNPVGYFYLREVQEQCPINKDNYSIQDLEFLLDAALKFTFTKVDKIFGYYEDTVDTKTGKTQLKLDYWQPSTFRFLDKYISHFSPEWQEKYNSDRRKGYAEVQAHMNRLNHVSVSEINERLPLVSVVIPSYNSASYVSRAIESVIVQNLENIEIIVVDDASTDDTEAILKKRYANDRRVRVIRHESNKKLGASRNTGLRAARGTYVYFLDADDWLEKGALAHLATIGEKYKAEIVECGVKKVWDDGKSERYHSHAFSCRGGREALEYLSDYYIGSIAWNKLYNREFLVGNNLGFVVPYWHEDVLFSMRAAYLASKYISVNTLYHNYFQNSDSVTHMKPTKLHLESYIALYAGVARFIEEIKLCDDEKGKLLARHLVKAHCSNELYPKIVRYAKSRSQKEWESDCFEAALAVLGPSGYAVADFLVAAMQNKKETTVQNHSRTDSFTGSVLKEYYTKYVPRRLKRPAKALYVKLFS